MLIGLLIAEVVIDIVWAIIYYPNGTYMNYGVGAVYGAAVWIPVLLVTFVAINTINRRP